MAKDIRLLSGFLSSLFSVAHCLAPAPLKLRPYGTIQIRLLLLLLLLFLTPVLVPGNEKKLRYAIQKSTKIKLDRTLLLLLHIPVE